MGNGFRMLKGHYIICGAGRTGQVIAEILEKEGKKFIFIDKSSKAIESSRKNYRLIEGNITEEETLKKGGIENAAGLFSVVNSDADNLLTVLLSREMRPKMPIYARASTRKIVQRIMNAGATFVISPAIACGESLALNMINQQKVRGYFGSHVTSRRV